jgi:hypothetical protein
MKKRKHNDPDTKSQKGILSEKDVYRVVSSFSHQPFPRVYGAVMFKSSSVRLRETIKHHKAEGEQAAN